MSAEVRLLDGPLRGVRTVADPQARTLRFPQPTAIRWTEAEAAQVSAPNPDVLVYERMVVPGRGPAGRAALYVDAVDGYARPLFAFIRIERGGVATTSLELLYGILTSPVRRRFIEQMAEVRAVRPTPEAAFAALREAALAAGEAVAAQAETLRRQPGGDDA